MKQSKTVSLLITLIASCAHAGDWPQWRGVHRDNTLDEPALPQAFPADGLKVLWRAEAGTGFSSPVIADGRVYLIDAVLTKPEAKERVRCFDAISGRVIWESSYAVVYPDWTFEPQQSGGPNGTPIVDGGFIYTRGEMGNVRCLDAATGELKWERRFDHDFGTTEFTGTASPLIEAGKLIVFTGGKDGPLVAALDKLTGRDVWTALPGEHHTYSSPVVITAGGVRQLITWSMESVAALDPATGKTWWRHPLETTRDHAVATPVVSGDRLLVGGVMFSLDPRKPAASMLWPGQVAQTRRVFSRTSTAIIDGDHLYTARLNGKFGCHEAATGKLVWETDTLTHPSGGTVIIPFRDGDTALLFTNEGNLIRARLTPAGCTELSRTRIIDPDYEFSWMHHAWSPPTFAEGRLFVRNHHELLCRALRR
jgi:outer membrane protein assembly factor BamB